MMYDITTINPETWNPVKFLEDLNDSLRIGPYWVKDILIIALEIIEKRIDTFHEDFYIIYNDRYERQDPRYENKGYICSGAEYTSPVFMFLYRDGNEFYRFNFSIRGMNKGFPGYSDSVAGTIDPSDVWVEKKEKINERYFTTHRSYMRHYPLVRLLDSRGMIEHDTITYGSTEFDINTHFQNFCFLYFVCLLIFLVGLVSITEEFLYDES